MGQGMMIRGGVNEDGPFIDEGPHIKEVWGLFATISGKEQFFGWVTKKKNARKICERRNKRYHGRPFYARLIFVATDEHERRVTQYESQADLQAGLAEKVSRVTEAYRDATDEGFFFPIDPEDNPRYTKDEADIEQGSIAEQVIEQARKRLDTDRPTGHSVSQERGDTPADRGTESGSEGPKAGDGIRDDETATDNA